MVPALTGVDEPREGEVIKGVGENTGRRKDFLRRKIITGLRSHENSKLSTLSRRSRIKPPAA